MFRKKKALVAYWDHSFLSRGRQRSTPPVWSSTILLGVQRIILKISATKIGDNAISYDLSWRYPTTAHIENQPSLSAVEEAFRLYGDNGSAEVIHISLDDQEALLWAESLLGELMVDALSAAAYSNEVVAIIESWAKIVEQSLARMADRRHVSHSKYPQLLSKANISLEDRLNDFLRPVVKKIAGNGRNDD